VSRRRASVLAAAVALLSTAQAAPAATLDVPLLGPGHEQTGEISAHVDTPVAEVDVQASAARISASVSAPPPQIEIPPPASPAEPSAPSASKRPPSRTKADRRAVRRVHQQQPVRSSASDRPVPPDPPSGRMPAATAEEVGGLPSRSFSRSFLPKASPSADGSLTAAAAASAGATAALTGLVVAAIALLSWIALQRPRTLSPPLLSFALQRPG
jgi:hypothetical protein